jgi:hypothetical protein
MRWLILAFVLGCGSSKPSGGGPIDDPAPTPRVIPALPAGCPATMGEASGVCDTAVSPSNCQWTEGQCHCGYPLVCSGAARDPDEVPREPPTWQCAGWPPAVRPDGCPGEIGGRCSEEGKQCVYGDCCVATYTCDGGEWKQTQAECPP